MHQNKKLENEFFSFLLKQVKKEKWRQDETKNQLLVYYNSQRVTDNNKQVNQKKLTKLVSNPNQENIRNIDKEKANRY